MKVTTLNNVLNTLTIMKVCIGIYVLKAEPELAISIICFSVLLRALSMLVIRGFSKPHVTVINVKEPVLIRKPIDWNNC